MAIRTHVNIHSVDGIGQKSKFIYESLAPIPADSDVNAMVAAWKAMTRLGVEAVTITYPLAGFAVIPADDADARIGDSAFLQCHKSEAVGGTHTFKLAAINAALLNADGSFILNSVEFSDFCEWFDDGSGLFGLQGSFTVSDGEQLAENGSNPTLPSGLTQIAGRVKNKRR